MNPTLIFNQKPGDGLTDAVRRQLLADVRRLLQPFPVVWELLTPPRIVLKRPNIADVYFHATACPSVLLIEIPDVEFDPETGVVTLPGNRFGVMVLQ